MKKQFLDWKKFYIGETKRSLKDRNAKHQGYNINNSTRKERQWNHFCLKLKISSRWHVIQSLQLSVTGYHYWILSHPRDRMGMVLWSVFVNWTKYCDLSHFLSGCWPYDCMEHHQRSIKLALLNPTQQPELKSNKKAPPGAKYISQNDKLSLCRIKHKYLHKLFTITFCPFI